MFNFLNPKTMHKQLTLLATMALALVACNKSQTIVTETPGEISFKAVTSVATKADPEITGSTLPSKDYILYVQALKSGQSTPSYYFSDVTEFKTTTEDTPVSSSAEYHADPKQYWPVGGAQLDFMALALTEGDKTTLNPDFATNVGRIGIANWDVYTNQIDLLFASKNNQSRAVSISLPFNHALSLLSFEAKATVANVIEITSIELVDLIPGGSFELDNTKNTPEIKWTPSTVDVNKDAVKGTVSGALTTDYTHKGDNLLVIPQGKKNIKVTYTIGGNTYEYIYNNERTSWDAGKKYVYQLNFDMHEIIFTESVATWDISSPAGNIEVPIQ